MTPVINCPPMAVRAIDDALMFADDLTFGDNDDAIRINTQADRPVGEGSRHAVTVAVKVNKTGRRDALAVVHKAVKSRRQRHKRRFFALPDIKNRARLASMGNLAPEFLTTTFKPIVQGFKGWKTGRDLPEPMAGVSDVLFNLTLLPSRRRIAKIRVEQIMTGHRRKARVNLPLLAGADTIDGGAHIVVNPASRHAAQNPERVVMGVKQHFMRLKKVGSQNKSPAMRQLDVRDLQLHSFVANKGPIFTPVELKRLAGLKGQRNKRPASAGVLLAALFRLPVARKSRDTAVGAGKAESNKIDMELFQRPLLLAGLASLHFEHTRQLIGKGRKLAGTRRRPELRLNYGAAQIFADRVARQFRSTGNLSDRQMIA